MDYGRINSYWDVAQQPGTFSTLPDDDFLALLQKQFPTTIPTGPKPFDTAPDGVDPSVITTFPLPNTSPSSSDSSPSPPSAGNDPPSRPQSGIFSPDSDQMADDPRLKRKASDESRTDEPTHKNPHTSGGSHSKKLSSSRRKSTGNPHQDEFRLLKRKEQNRAAQRAFRERKEKHVKDLEDKVAELEAKNQTAESENENLRDLLSRLQSENMALKQNNFTFSVPKDGSVAPSFNSTPTPADANPNFASPPIASSSTSPSVAPNAAPSFDFNFGQLIPFDLSVLDENPSTATDGAMNMDYGFGSSVTGHLPYRTLASNPQYMSFAEPMPLDPPGFGGLDMSPFDTWSPPQSSSESSLSNHNTDSFDQLFGGNYLSAQSPVDFSALLRSPPSSISPVSHQSHRSNSQSSTSANTPAVSTPASTSSSSSPSLSSSGSPATPISLNGVNGHVTGTGDCPRTKDELKQAIERSGASSFVEPPKDPTSFLRKSCDPTNGPVVMCVKGSSFPKTEKSDNNIEVLTAWRTITSDPQFKDVDINELCTEFTSKARCDGTKVVLEPEGVHHIIETLAARRASQTQL